MVDSEKFYEALSQGKMDEAKRLTQEALDAGESAAKVLKDGLIAAMDRIGVKFKNGELYIPEVLIAARAMHAGMAILKPILAKSEGVMAGKVVIGTVKGDLHDIGKNLVGLMLEGAGFQVKDLGSDVTPEKYVEAVRESGANLVAMSALLTTTMGSMKGVIEALQASGVRPQVKVMIGGAPVTQQYANEIGADGYSDNASGAVTLARKMLGVK